MPQDEARPKGKSEKEWTNPRKKSTKRSRRRDKEKHKRGFRPLRDFYAKIPGVLCTVEAFLIHIIHGLAGLALVIVSVTEFQRVAILPFLIDAFYPLCVVIYDILSLAFHFPSGGWHVLMALAGYQSLLSTMLFIGEKRRGRRMRAPPLFAFITYAVMPWSTISLWFVTLSPDDKPWPWALEAALLIPLLGARWRLRKKDSWRHRILEFLFCMTVFGLLRVLLFGNNFWRAIRNWKYVIAGCNLAWPFWALPILVKYFQKKEQRTQRQDEERPRIPPSKLPSKSMQPTASMKSNMNNPTA